MQKVMTMRPLVVEIVLDWGRIKAEMISFNSINGRGVYSGLLDLLVQLDPVHHPHRGQHNNKGIYEGLSHQKLDHEDDEDGLLGGMSCCEVTSLF